MTLDQLPLGQSAKILKLTGAPAVRRRLMEMGITPAATVQAIRWAPWAILSMSSSAAIT